MEFRSTVEQCGSPVIITLAKRRRCLENLLAFQLQGRINAFSKCHVLLDFANVEYLTAAELGTLVDLHKKLKRWGGRLTLFHLSDRTFEILQVTHLDRFLATCQDNEPVAAAAGAAALVQT